MSLKQTNIRISVTYKQKPKLFILNRDCDFSNLKIQIAQRFGLQIDIDMKIYHKMFKAEIEDPNMLKDDDEVFILAENDDENFDMDEKHHQKPKDDPNLEKKENEADDSIKEETNNSVQKTNILTTIALEPDFQSKEYADRDELNTEAKEWAHTHGFALVTKEGEKINREGIKTTSLYCNVNGCKFFLRFKTNNKGLYKLYSFDSEHSKHEKIDYPLIDSKVKTQISSLSSRVKSKTDLKEIINENCNSKLSYHQVYYQSQKVKDETYGKPSDDAKHLLLHLIENQHLKTHKFAFEKDTNSGELLKLIFVSKDMFQKYQIYHDVILIDSTLQKNKFNMPLISILGINEEGKTIIFGFSLLNNEKTESYKWLFRNFLQITKKQPNIIFSDEAEPIIQSKMFFSVIDLLIGISLELNNSVHLYCAWHRSKNFKKHFLYLNKTKSLKSLYNTITSLPYTDKISTFENTYQEILQNKELSQESISYLKSNYECKDKWAKCFHMNFFTCGIFTTQRIESFHSQVSEKINLTSTLQEVFEFFINFKNKTHDKLEEEKDSVLPKNVSKGYEQVRILESLGELVHPYFYEKIKKQYHDGLNYNVEDLAKGKKW